MVIKIHKHLILGAKPSHRCSQPYHRIKLVFSIDKSQFTSRTPIDYITIDVCTIQFVDF